MSTCVLVLGVPRSGTSCVAGVLHRLGVDMGNSFTELEPGWNDKGSFIDKEFDDLIGEIHSCDDFLNTIDLTWSLNKLYTVRQFIQNRNQNAHWGVKHHLLSYFAHIFYRLPNVKVINTQRPLLKSIASWKARGGLHPDESAEKYFLRLNNMNNFAVSNAPQPILTVDFDTLLDNTSNQVQIIADFIGIHTKQEAIDFVDSGFRRF